MKHICKFYQNPDHEIPGYVDFTVYADPKKLLSEYGAEYVWTVSREEQREQRERHNRFVEALTSGDAEQLKSMMQSAVSEALFELALDGVKVEGVDEKKLTDTLMGCIEVEEEDNI